MPISTLIEKPDNISWSERLKSRTAASHQRVETALMNYNAFTSRESYARFLHVQYEFHRDIDGLYLHPDLASRVETLPSLSRFREVDQDLADLDLASPAPLASPLLNAGVDAATALGWLYVAEGSKLGAALILKEVAKLGLSTDFGARHLAGAPEGRARNWRRFTGAINAVDFSHDKGAAMIAGAESGFMRVETLLTKYFSA